MSERSEGPLASANAGVRFLLEVAALVVLGAWGYRVGGGGPAGLALALGFPLTVAAVWGLVGAPGAPYRLDRLGRLGIEVAVFGGATLALYALGGPLPALGFGGAAAINTALLYLLEE